MPALKSVESAGSMVSPKNGIASLGCSQGQNWRLGCPKIVPELQDLGAPLMQVSVPAVLWLMGRHAPAPFSSTLCPSFVGKEIRLH